MKLLVDSSFFLPFLGVKIKQFPRKAILELMEKEEVIRTELVIFELSAKGCKLVNNGKITVEEFTQGLTAVKYLEGIEAIPIHYTEIQTLACELRKKHSDYIDCLQLATAVYYAEGMMTLDKEIKRKAKEEWKELLKNTNEKFTTILWDEYEKKK